MKSVTSELERDTQGVQWQVVVQDDKAYRVHWAHFLGWSSGSMPRTWDDAPVRAQLTFKDQMSAKLDDIKVEPRWENRGIGSMLLTWIEQYAVKCGIQNLRGDI